MTPAHEKSAHEKSAQEKSAHEKSAHEKSAHEKSAREKSAHAKALQVLAATALLTLSIAGLSRAPWTPPGADDAVLRLSWRMVIPAREDCRPRTAAELEGLPVHMRAPEVCTAEVARYTLTTRLGDEAPVTLELARGGLRGDRPLFVLEERRLPPGPHRVSVALKRTSASGETEVVAALDSLLEMRPGAVLLVTLDGERLVARGPADQPPD
jgi:hypothetical protein